jgi:outer membrane biosynthesis protein TonB
MTDQLRPDFEKRLKAGLDRVRPPTPLPQAARFNRLPPRRRRLFSFKPALALAAALAVLMVAASALTGSANPATWTQRAVTTIESVTHAPQTSPSPSPPASPKTQPQPPVRVEPTSEPNHESPEPGGDTQPQPSEPPEASGTPAPEGGLSSPSPSPSNG